MHKSLLCVEKVTPLQPVKIRTALEPDLNKRQTYQGTFVRCGFFWENSRKKKETVLIRDIKQIQSRDIIADHIWLSCTDGFKKANLCPGDLVQFAATPQTYTKMIQGELVVDFNLKFPRHIRNLSKCGEIPQ